MLTPTFVILSLKVAVTAVTLLLCASLVALYRGNARLHGRINLAFFILTMAALVFFELATRVLDPNLFEAIWKDPALATRLRIHLGFAVPSAILMCAMIFTGLKRRIRVHQKIAWFFIACWGGTFYTGIFWLPNKVEKFVSPIQQASSHGEEKN